MRCLAAAVVAVASFAAQAQPALNVLRVSPTGDAAPTSEVTVAFDRPVAGSLDRSVDPRALFRITPPHAGTVEWRDPITLRFIPTAPLTPATSYTVTIANTFQAMDGSRLAAPYRFSFRVRGPAILTGSPVAAYKRPLYLRPRTKFEIVTSSAVDLARLGSAVRLEFGDSCNVRRTISLRAISQRAVSRNDPYDYRAGRGGSAGTARDSLRRVVALVPEQPMPAACRGEMVVPTMLDVEGTAQYQRWVFRTAGPLALLAASCSHSAICPKGPLALRFSTPVRGTELLRRLTLRPAVPFSVHDSTAEQAQWQIDAALVPRTTYVVTLDSSLTDAFGQKLGGERARQVATTGFAPSVSYANGRVVVERNGFRTLAVTHVNVDTLEVWTSPVPDSLTRQFARAYAWNLTDLWRGLDTTTRRRIPVKNVQDRPMVSVIRVPAYDARRAGMPVLTALRISNPRADSTYERRPVVLAQVTNLGVHAKIGAQNGEVWVTALDNGRALAGANVKLFDQRGRRRAEVQTDATGLARLDAFRVSPEDTALTDEERYDSGFEGMVDVTLGDDRAVVPINRYDYDLSPWQLRVYAAWGNDREPAAGAVFTERGIYRPGEPVYAKAIVRDGPLGSLRVPAADDSLRWIFTDRENGTLRDTTVALSPFGTADQRLTLPGGVALGTYQVAVQTRTAGRWSELARTSYRVAEYRPPEFLVDVTAPDTPRFAGDSITTTIEARYLFGAPMARAAVTWTAQQTPLDPWQIAIPGTDGFFYGESTWWWEDGAAETSQRPTVIGSGVDTLDGAGRSVVRLALAAPPKARPAHASISATITDVNRQTVSDAASVVVHPAAFYLGAKPEGESYFWVAGTPRRIAMIAVRPDGQRVPGIAIRGTVVRREWHRVERVRDGDSDVHSEWVSDTVSHCALTSAADPVYCDFTPPAGGVYVVTFRATDAAGREAVTSLVRWAAGKGFVPWYDENQFKMDVIADKVRYAVGDTATVLFAVPFTDAEAWLTIEREGVIERRRLRITAGATTLKLPITESFAPNVFISMFVARGRSAPPGRPDDPGRPTIRVGYTEIRVTPEVKRLSVALEPVASEFRPGDTARVRVQVRDAGGTGRRSEVTLWAVDEGVLALTGYATPDPIDLIYRARGLGLHLASNLTAVAAQVALEGITIKGDTSPGGGGGRDASGVLRSQFRPTAFFLASVVTDADGRALAAGKLPDNLTTFRVMAVAVTAGDRYGKGQSPLLVTRPLVARPALPRFLRRDDQFIAGVVVNQRAGGTPTVRVEATATGVVLREPAVKTTTLAAGRGSEVRFAMRDTTSDTALLRFRVSDGTNADAVETRLPVQPSFHARAYTVAGVLRDTATATFTLPDGIDPARSRLELSLGTSPLALVRGAFRLLRVYPYDCTEQLTSQVLPLIALVRAQQAGAKDLKLPTDWRQQIETAVATIVRRQRGDGGIGMWSAEDWTTPWLTAYAGTALIAARQVGIAVNDSTLARLGEYVRTGLHKPTALLAPVAWWYSSLQTRLADQVAAVDFLSRLGKPDVAAENDLLRLAAQLAWEDRARLAHVLARRGALNAARRLLEPAWAQVKVEGRRAVLPGDARRPFYFSSEQRPAATLLLATLAVDSVHDLIGPLVETLAEQGRARRLTPWNTQDFGSVLTALAAFEIRQRGAAARAVRIAAAGRPLLDFSPGTLRDSTISLTGLLQPPRSGTRALSLQLEAPEAGPPVYFYFTVSEIPLQRPVTPDDAGIAVERWYEDYTTGKPIVGAVEGSLVRVRLRITLAAERQFVVVDDPLPAGLEAVDLSLRTVGALPGPGSGLARRDEMENAQEEATPGFDWYYGSWDSGWWSPFDHRELRDDRVVYVATVLWPGTFTATYVARATTPGTFVLPPVHTEEMYNPAVHGRSSGGTFTVTAKKP